MRSLNANYLKEITNLKLINQTLHLKADQLEMMVENYQNELNQTRIEMMLYRNKAEKFETKIIHYENELNSMAIDVKSYQNQSEAYQFEIALFKNESEMYKKEVELLKNETAEIKLEIASLKIETEAYKIEAESYKKQYLEFLRFELIAESTIMITVVNQNSYSKTSDLCLGLSTEVGIITSAKCCLADDVDLIDNETNNRIEILKNEIRINELESICFINPAENFDFAFDSPVKTDRCSIKTYNQYNSKLTIYNVENDDIQCQEGECQFDIILTGNETILDGSAVLCGNAIIGIIEKSKIF